VVIIIVLIHTLHTDLNIPYVIYVIHERINKYLNNLKPIPLIPKPKFEKQTTNFILYDMTWLILPLGQINL